MTKYVKKLETIEAFQFPEVFDIDGRIEMEEWIGKHKGDQEFRYVGDTLKITPGPSVLYSYKWTVNQGDWLVVFDGNIGGMTHLVFTGTYERENTVTVINVDSRVAEQDVEEKIRKVLEEVRPQLEKQTSEMVVNIMDRELKGNFRGRI